MAAAAADWEGLHEDLLGLIVKKIKLIEDFVCFGMVCKSWNEAVSNNKQYLPPQIPWLMLAEDETTKNGRRQIYHLSSSKDNDKISSRSLYFPPDRRCIGLNYGWMLTISRNGGDMNLVNPLSSNSEIKLPNQTAVDNYNVDYETWPAYLFTIKAALSGNPSESSSNFTLMILHSYGALVCFWRPGDTRWTSTIHIKSRLYDLIYSHKDDQFYGTSWNGIIWACIIQHDRIVLRQITMIDGGQNFNSSTWIYIVESATPGVLQLVLRDGDIECNDDVEAVGKDEEEPNNNLYDDTYMKYGLIDFRVYELDLINGGCSKIMNLGDRAIFVGHNTSISFDASQFIGVIRPNHIYFTDDDMEWYPCLIKGGGNDMGCYSLEDDKITRFNVDLSLARGRSVWRDEQIGCINKYGSGRRIFMPKKELHCEGYSDAMCVIAMNLGSVYGYAVVIGANKWIGFEICRQLASQCNSVVLTACNEKRGIQAVEKLKRSVLSDNIMFHQFDVMDLASVSSIAEFTSWRKAKANANGSGKRTSTAMEI
ncbi:hypothetical protein BUALT_Bualt12G0005900 [Buddleja alternifolia]|uniref:KIB1-4 beta-propeller domain-containing protein n=1 Tax=Buddleja alternifolia TaxID=168488 RepID=A0AAV6WY63_9LAMI|nr:hypothetical protein BUALT_Bualt12G0005900 [Buddleja alternifolia]